MNPTTNKRILILGADGYLGYCAYHYFSTYGNTVHGIDNFSRRRNVADVGGDSLFPLGTLMDREEKIQHLSLTESAEKIIILLRTFRPDVIIHLAEQPSAPYSMMNARTATETQDNNVRGTMNLLWAIRVACPEVHLIKLGTLGEYGDWIYDNGLKIPESVNAFVTFPLTSYLKDSHTVRIPTPRFPGSFYHMSKVFDSMNIELACSLWKMRATDINQGVVYGTGIAELPVGEHTRFDYDSYFGTVINRFIVQAVAKIPLTVYGWGGQTRGYLHISDVMKALSLVMDNPPVAGSMEVVNQLTEVRSINEIAAFVQKETLCEVRTLTNPRVERESHQYNPTYEKLKQWGLTEPMQISNAIPGMIRDVAAFAGKINRSVVIPKTRWR